MTAHADVKTCPGVAPLIANGALLALHPASPDGKSLKIIAIGSSSTEGVGASAPSYAYPAQLAAELKLKFKIYAEVKNQGVGGETAPETLARLKATLDGPPADLVIWQVGTNDALLGMNPAGLRNELDDGIAEAQAKKEPLILIDQQLMTPRLHDAAYAQYVKVVDEEAARYHVPVLSRFAMMQALAENDPAGWKAIQSGDGVHMNDLGYQCLAHSLAGPIAEAARAPGVATR